MNYEMAVLITSRLLGFAMLLQGLENCIIARHPITVTLWSNPRLPRLNVLGWIEIIAAVAFILAPSLIPLLLLFATHFAICVYFRGSLNGGSDSMTFVVLTGLIVVHVSSDRMIGAYGLIYIAAHLSVSYFRAGLAKLIQPEWRSGRAIGHFLSRSFFSDSRIIGRKLMNSVGLSTTLCWSVIILEITLAFAAFMPSALCYLATFAMLMHLAIYFAFGLNRFFWAWLSAWPSVFFVSELLLLRLK